MASVENSLPSTKRLLLEGAAIIVSILLAFAIDAWWQDRTDYSHERQYLTQVRADVDENQRRLEEALRLERNQLASVRSILKAMRGSTPISIDAATRWTSIEPGFMWYSDPRLLDGTISSLIATDDINLIRNRALKVAAINYKSQLDNDLDQFRTGITQFLGQHDQLLAVLERSRVSGEGSAKGDIAAELVSISTNRAAAVTFRQIVKNIENRIRYLEQMRAANENMIAVLPPPLVK